ncbi:MAG: tetratricopeptide repeat protein [Proteobacteria bacterium]|nr:tetratricopeptide repeat protein [Pseudomonadota bacterium]MBU1450185.1 tetratricopeptide repeat protein [Pseudomonadota bacterium]
MEGGSSELMKLLIPIMGTIAGVAGWFLLSFSFVAGILLIIFGVITSVISILGTYVQDKQIQGIKFTQAVLFHKAGMGNIFKIQLDHEITRKGASNNVIKLLELALIVDPEDVDVMEELSAALALYISYCHFLNNKLSDKQLQEIRRVKQLCIAAKKRNPNSSMFYATVGMIWDIEDKHEEARKWFRKLGKLKADPYWRLYISTSWLLSGNYKEALIEMELAIKEGTKGGMVDFYYARSLEACGQYEKSLLFYESAIKIEVNNDQLYSNYASALHMTGNFLAASTYFMSLAFRMIFFRSKKSIYFFIRAVHLFFLGGLLNTSRAVWKITKFVPIINRFHVWLINPSEPYKTLLALRIEKGYVGEAEVLARKRLAILPKSPYAMSDLAVCAAHNGDTELAYSLLNKAIELKPNYIAFQWNIKQIDLWAKGRRGGVYYVDKKGSLQKKQSLLK